ncbi:cryptochrome/photolyase family protein [Limibaculum sp. M0105]|uniref:Cryptochrome/photolyase family protein n=1 Tax=Thermohalobaculum xanthum TaxID=2753746 RepID=A0A8J7M646_9RHOB|nr:cryptochrome/photolyase family protein [Thermohalobaculum xanthum]MBK0398931.1 cryptochrome/photolyase family protein [Thermohalobaculum xanthum]
MTRARRLLLVLGDQLDIRANALDRLDPERDAVVMTEAREEATYLRQHKKRLVLFFAAMRHFADELRARGFTVRYHAIDGEDPAATLAEGAARHPADEHHVTLPGDMRVRDALRDRFPGLVVHPDHHFLSTPAEFSDLREGRRRFILEDFYRAMRKKTGWLMDGDAPAGGRWNFDADNRKPFGRDGPGFTPGRPHSEPDEITRKVMRMVERLFPDAPGSTEGFAEPVTRRAALAHLRDFIDHRLPRFGDHQDAIATGHSTLWHSRLSTALNLKLVDPREVCAAAISAWANGHAPLNAVEGFVRQILGWREFVRGVYWAEMPGYAGLNALGADADLPGFFWTGDTVMACLADGLTQLLEEGYAHHIQRLMVMGLFAMLWGAHPYRVHEWHMELYLDAIDWVSLPNVLGMSQHGDGGIVGTKPYAASGAYISRMSDCCGGCRYDPRIATGPKACPFTTLYWDFLARHEARFRGNRRMAMQMANLSRKDDGELRDIRGAAESLRKRIA